MKVLDLFSGIGGFSLGLERAGMETVAFCEIEEFPRKVLKKHWPHVPIFEDVRKLKGDDIGPVDLICGGYPCQPFSLAGQRGGEEDDRHLWPEMFRLVQELRPAWVIGENVAGHISMGLDKVLSDLESARYACRPFVIPAVAVDAPHRRDRVWIVANDDSALRDRNEKHEIRAGRNAVEPCVGSVCHTESQRRRAGRQRGSTDAGKAQTESERQVQVAAAADATCQLPHRSRERAEQDGRTESADGCETLADSDSERLEVRQGKNTSGKRQDRRPQPERGQRWPAEPDVGRVAHGVPRRVDRLRALGNAVVPQIPEIIGLAIMAAEAEKRQ